jgi:uncharacterized protein (DUF488 family)
MIYSIGYQRLTPEILKETLRSHNITLLIDVRSTPYSRKPQFNRKKLEQRFGLNAYVWKGDILGGKFGPALETGIDFLCQLDRVGNQALMCLENDPRDCHRYQDIGIRLLQHDIDIIHLHDGITETTSQILKAIQ